MNQPNICKITEIIFLILIAAFATNIMMVNAKTYSFTAVISPSQIIANQVVTYSLVITNNGDSTLGSASIVIPTGFTVISPVIILTPSTSWNSTLSTELVSLTATVGGAVISQGENVTCTFEAIAPASSGVAIWTAEAFTSIDGGGVQLGLEGAQPMVEVASQFNPPIISASKSTVNQGQASVLSLTTNASGGVLPYQYQWLGAYNGGTFLPIIGANGIEYIFSTSILTSVGTWSFKLNITDSSSITTMVSSNIVYVIVNYELVVPEITATPNAIMQTQASALTSSSVTTGTSPYTFQWFQKFPGGEYVTVGENSNNYNFPGTSAIGIWNFLLQVTDSTGASINSSSVDLMVSSVPVFTIAVNQTTHGTITPGTTIVSLGENQTFIISPELGYKIVDVLVDGISVGPVTSYSFAGVTADHNISATFKTNDVAYFIDVISSIGSSTPSTIVSMGDNFLASVASPEVDGNHRWICTGFSVDGGIAVSGTSYTFINVQADHTIEFNWQEQYYLTVIAPSGSSAGEGWYNTGTITTVSVASNTIVFVNGTRKIFNGWTRDTMGTSITSDPIKIDGPMTAEATWNIQYQVSYAVSGNTLQMTSPLTEWVNSGSSSTGVFPESVYNSAGNTRNIFLSSDRPDVITQPVIVTGIYQTQYLVTFIPKGLGPDAKGTVATILSNSKTYDQFPEVAWINAGESIYFNYATIVETTDRNEQYILESINATSPVVISEPVTIQGYYEQQINSGFTVDTFALIAIPATVGTSLSITLIAARKTGKKKIEPIPSEGGTISPSSIQTVNSGDDSTVFIITADSGYKIVDVVIDSNIHLGAVRTHKFANVKRNHTITAVFEKQEDVIPKLQSTLTSLQESKVA